MARRAIRFAPMFTVYLVAVWTTGCATGKPFVDSTLDHNGGRMNSRSVQGSVDAVAANVIRLGKERGLVLVKKRETQRGTMVLSLKQDISRVRGFETDSVGGYYKGFGASHSSTSVVEVESGSLFYVELSPASDEILVEMVGLPAVEGVVSCPPLVQQRYRQCVPAEGFAHGVSFRNSMEVDLGVRLDARRERDVVTGILGEL